MFCFQCQQTAHNHGCEGKKGVCGKTSDNANLQDELVGGLITLAMAVKKDSCTLSRNDTTDELMLTGLFSTITNVNFDDSSVYELISQVRTEVNRIRVDMPSYRLMDIWNANEDIRSLKSLILFGLKGMAAYAYHANILGFTDNNVIEFFYEALNEIGECNDTDKLLKLVLKAGSVNLTCMELLDKAHTSTYGDPVPTKVSLTIKKGPFIVVSGHDLHDLKLLLEQTKDKGINIYTHSEMLPAHGYPKLKEYPNLAGNFGTAWQNQQTEFHNIPGPILFTTNCIMPVRESYSDRVFTTSVVAYPEIVHIGNDKDFTPIINKAIECGGYKEDKHLLGINGGDTVMTGFARKSVLDNSEKIIDLVKQKKIRHIFLVGGCDGAAPGRNYYTDFVKKLPNDTIVLTLACGKYRFNDINLGDIEGIPRLLDMGQCNDAYSAIYVAVQLAKAFECEVNELPLSMVLSWYEQKAVCILMTLLSLGIKNIILGPTLPAFLSPNVTKILVDTFNISAISTPEEDIRKCLNS